MKTLNETFTDAEMIRLKRAKSKIRPGVTWHDYIMSLAPRQRREKKHDGIY